MLTVHHHGEGMILEGGHKFNWLNHSKRLSNCWQVFSFSWNSNLAKFLLYAYLPFSSMHKNRK